VLQLATLDAVQTGNVGLLQAATVISPPAWCGNEARLHFQGTLAGHLHSGFWRYLQLWYMIVSGCGERSDHVAYDT